MSELSTTEKQRLVNAATQAIEKSARLHGTTLAQMPKPFVSLLIEIFQAGVIFWNEEQKRIKEETEKEVANNF